MASIAAQTIPAAPDPVPVVLDPATTALLSRSTDKADYGLTMGTAQTFAGISRLVAPVLSTAIACMPRSSRSSRHQPAT